VTFRGYFALNGVEFANSSRVVAHLKPYTPETDDEAFGTGDCALEEYSDGLYVIPDESLEVSDELWSPPDGSRRVSHGLMEVKDKCWTPSKLCGCRLSVKVADSWDALQGFLGDPVYRPETAPWSSTEFPESLEFGGVWVVRVDGLDTTPVERAITEMTGSGAVAGIHRDSSRTITFEAILVACSSAGLQYGLGWLACQLRAATVDGGSTLNFLAAHPGNSFVDPTSLWREARNVVLTQAPEIMEAQGNGIANSQATIYRVQWEMVACSPYIYLPEQTYPIEEWDAVTMQPVNWVHDAACTRPDSCASMPVLFSADCAPEMLSEVSTPPPVCGGCLPVGGIDSHTFKVPLVAAPMRCRSTTVSLLITNTGAEPLSLQGFFQPTTADPRCEDRWFPVQVNGLVPGATLHLDGVSGRFHAFFDGRRRRPVGVVGTPSGAPWRPAVIDRYTEWEFVVHTAPNVDFETTMILHDRES
jgi:hypothetical protein